MVDGQIELAKLESAGHGQSAVAEVWTKDGGKRHERNQLRDARGRGAEASIHHPPLIFNTDVSVAILAP